MQGHLPHSIFAVKIKDEEISEAVTEKEENGSREHRRRKTLETQVISPLRAGNQSGEGKAPLSQLAHTAVWGYWIPLGRIKEVD